MENSNLTTIKFENPDMTTGEVVSNTVEVEILAPNNEIESRLAEIQDQLCVLDEELGRLTNDADKWDYFVAVGSGIIAGFIDAIFVGKWDFNLKNAEAELTEKLQSIIKKVATDKGYKGNREGGYIQKVGGAYKVEQDSIYRQKELSGITNSSHHLDDLAHHPTILGLVSAIAVSFFRIAYLQNSKGKFFLAVKEVKNTRLARNRSCVRGYRSCCCCNSDLKHNTV